MYVRPPSSLLLPFPLFLRSNPSSPHTTQFHHRSNETKRNEQEKALKAVQTEKKALEKGVQDARKRIEKGQKEDRALGKKEGGQRKVVAKRKEELAKK